MKTIRNRLGFVLALASTAIAFAIALWISAFWEEGRDQIRRGNPVGEVIFIFFPLVFCLAGVWASASATLTGKALLSGAAFGLLLFCFLTLFTIGPFFLPAIIPLVLAAVAHATLATDGAGRVPPDDLSSG